jgi:RNA polymerase sigma factor (sigma-70 family)
MAADLNADVTTLLQEVRRDEPGALDRLAQLATLNARQARVVELRYFGGHTMREVADLLGVSLSTAEKDFDKAIAFLHRRIQEAG